MVIVNYFCKEIGFGSRKGFRRYVFGWSKVRRESFFLRYRRRGGF